MAKRRPGRIAGVVVGALLAGILPAVGASSAPARKGFDPIDMPAAKAAYQQADARIDAARTAYRAALVPLLHSPDPFRRRLALERLRAGYNWSLFDHDVQEAVLPILEETELLASETCVREPVRCGEEPAISNGMLAARLRRGDVMPDLLIARVTARPAIVDALVAAGVTMTNTKGLSATRDPAAQAALLRLMLPALCGYSGAPPDLATLMDSPDVTVRRLAALAIVRFTGCRMASASRSDQARKRAIAAVAARFDNAADTDVLIDCGRIGAAAEAFIPQLLVRLERRPRDDRERRLILQTFAAMNEYATQKQPAISSLYRLLLDPAERALHGLALSGLLALWPHSAPECKPALLALIKAEPELFTKGLALLYAWGAQPTSDELASLVAIHRRGCLDDDDEICSWQNRTLRYLAGDNNVQSPP
jgi:hypothetical protein